MAESSKSQLDKLQEQLIDKLANNDKDGFQQLIAQVKGDVNKTMEENSKSQLHKLQKQLIDKVVNNDKHGFQQLIAQVKGGVNKTLAENSKPQLDELQKQLIDKLANNDKDGFKQLIAQVNGDVNKTMAEKRKSQLDEVQKQLYDKLANNDKDGFKLPIVQVKGDVNKTMAEKSKSQLDEVQKQLFDKLANNDKDGFKLPIAQVKGDVNKTMAENSKSQLDEVQKQLYDKLANNDKDGFKLPIAQVKGDVNKTMAENSKSQSDEVQKQIFDKLANNDMDGFKQLIAQVKEGLNFVDEKGRTPLQLACRKGNKDAVQILLDMGADVEYSENDQNLTSLHFAGTSGNTEICRMLLDAGSNPNALSRIGVHASSMAALTGNSACADTIRNYISESQLEYYTTPQGLQNEPLLPASIVHNFRKFVEYTNLHPVRIALNLVNFNLQKHLPALKKVLELMCEREGRKTPNVEVCEVDVMPVKFHYLSWIIKELLRCEENCKAQRKDNPSAKEPNKHDFVAIFIKRVLKENKLGQLDYIDFTVRDCVREFPFRDCLQYSALCGMARVQPALDFLRGITVGQREESSYCSSCGNEKPNNKCSKCKAVQYCDRECQRLHWFMHKKTCNRPISATATNTAPKGWRYPTNAEPDMCDILLGKAK